MPSKILIVDDDPVNLDLLEQLLTKEGYVSERASSGEEALNKVESFLPDVIVLDYMMPKMNGVEVVKRLKRDERYVGIPVILLTAMESQEDKVRGLDAGADDYVVKPFRSLELLARVRSMLRIKQMHDSMAQMHESLKGWNSSLADQVRQQIADLQRTARLKRYLSPQIAESILKSKDEILFQSHRREITVVFLDLRGFTSFADNAKPEEVLSLLRDYHTEMGNLIFKYEGAVEHFAGDGIMVFFNDPVLQENHTERAIRMAVEMRSKVKELRAEWLKKGYVLDLGVGLDSGYASLGNIGFEGRMDYGAVGRVTIRASRLCAEAKGGEILTTRKTLSRVTDLVESEPLGELQLKGFARPTSVFNIAGLRTSLVTKFMD